MGLLTHVAEIEYHYGNIDVNEMREILVNALQSTKNFEIQESVKGMFERRGHKHSVSHVHMIKNDPLDESKVLYAICTSPLLRFKDDVAFSINVVAENNVIVKGLSVSRLGEGDFFKNKKNLDIIMRKVQIKFKLNKTTIIRS